ncbi:MAG: hypothetical protein KIT18_07380 [Burkholderiales bacterium]|nr:hypothetical protein [Burkholderiales bacterium]
MTHAKIIAAIEAPAVIIKILTHLGACQSAPRHGRWPSPRRPDMGKRCFELSYTHGVASVLYVIQSLLKLAPVILHGKGR